MRVDKSLRSVTAVEFVAAFMSVNNLKSSKCITVHFHFKTCLHTFTPIQRYVSE